MIEFVQFFIRMVLPVVIAGKIFSGKRAVLHLGSLTATAFLIAAPALADERSADGWESPAKLKPYVKLQPDTGKSSSPPTPEAANSARSPDAKEIDKAVRSILSESGPDIGILRRDKKAAKRLAKYQWLDKAAEANPSIIEAITSHQSAAKLLAKHPRLAHIAAADHYLCRRITKWKSAARILARNGDVKEVAEFDPEGLYFAIEHDKKIVRLLSKNPIFDQMVVENPDLGRVIAKYM